MAAPTPNAPNKEAVDRFRDALTAILGPASPDMRLGLAFSGGPDSLALLLLCNAAFPGQIWVATVDHGLRAESAAEADWCADLCAKMAIPHAILTPDTPITGSVQAAARKARYALLDQWSDANRLCAVMTAHHADDQVETLMMRLNRGSGLAGMAGIRTMHEQLIRPLLGWRRSDLAAIVSQSGLTAIDDPSNRNDQFDRVRMRKILADADWLDVDRAARTANALAEADSAIEWATDMVEGDHLFEKPGQYIISCPDGLPPEILRRLIVRTLAKLDPRSNPTGPETMRFIATIMAGGKASIGHLIGENRKGDIYLSLAPPRSPRTGINSA